MSVNVTGMFTVLQSVAKRMAASTTDTPKSTDNSAEHKFSIVNTSSVAALRGTPAMVAYSSSKAAVIAMTVASAKGEFTFTLEKLRNPLINTFFPRYIHLLNLSFFYRSRSPRNSSKLH